MIERFWLPRDISTFGPRVDFLFVLIFWITVVTWILVTIAMIAFMVLYRSKPGRKATYIDGSPTLEMFWTAATGVILVVLALLSRSTWADIKEHGPPGDVFYRITAKQFNWEIAYPGPDGKVGTADDITRDNDLHVPVNKVVRIQLASKDVIHSFFVPVLRLKQDAVPGRDINVWFEAIETGQYEIPCAELCGFGHSGMKGTLYVDSEQDYQKFIANLNANK